MIVYVQQYGAFWKLSLGEWLELCRKASAEGGYVLPEKAALQRRPSFIHKNSVGRGYWISSSKHLYREPLDWTTQDFLDELKTCNQFGGQ